MLFFNEVISSFFVGEELRGFLQGVQKGMMLERRDGTDVTVGNSFSSVDNNLLHKLLHAYLFFRQRQMTKAVNVILI